MNKKEKNNNLDLLEQDYYLNNKFNISKTLELYFLQFDDLKLDISENLKNIPTSDKYYTEIKYKKGIIYKPTNIPVLTSHFTSKHLYKDVYKKDYPMLSKLADKQFQDLYTIKPLKYKETDENQIKKRCQESLNNKYEELNNLKDKYSKTEYTFEEVNFEREVNFKKEVIFEDIKKTYNINKPFNLTDIFLTGILFIISTLLFNYYVGVCIAFTVLLFYKVLNENALLSDNNNEKQTKNQDNNSNNVLKISEPYYLNPTYMKEKERLRNEIIELENNILKLDLNLNKNLEINKNDESDGNYLPLSKVISIRKDVIRKVDLRQDLNIFNIIMFNPDTFEVRRLYSFLNFEASTSKRLVFSGLTGYNTLVNHIISNLKDFNDADKYIKSKNEFNKYAAFCQNAYLSYATEQNILLSLEKIHELREFKKQMEIEAKLKKANQLSENTFALESQFKKQLEKISKDLEKEQTNFKQLLQENQKIIETVKI